MAKSTSKTKVPHLGGQQRTRNQVRLLCHWGPKAGHLSGSVSLLINWVHQEALASARPFPLEGHQSCFQKGRLWDDSETQDRVLNSNLMAIPRTNAAT